MSMDPHSVSGANEEEAKEKGSHSSSSLLPNHHNPVDASGKDDNFDDAQKAESEAVIDLVGESENDERSDPAEEIPDGNQYEPDHQNSTQELLVSEKLEEQKKVAYLDSTDDPEDQSTLSAEIPIEDPLPSKAELPLEDTRNGIPTPLLDSVSKGIDSFLGQKGIDSFPDQIDVSVSPILNISEPKGIEPDLDEKNETPSALNGSETEETEGNKFPPSDSNLEESAGTVDLVPNQEAKVTGDRDSYMSEVPQSTENQRFVAVALQPHQQTSWRGCCGLFEVLRRPDR